MSLLASRIRRRWTAAQNAAATLLPGSLVYITDTPGVAVHNGVTPGGLVLTSGASGPPAAALTTTAFGAPRSDFTGRAGVAFTVAEDCIVTRLGRYKFAGNSGSHVLRLTAESGYAEIASCTVNLASGTAGQFIFTDLASPVTLTALTVYYLTSDETTGSDEWATTGGGSSTVYSSSNDTLTAFVPAYYESGTWGKTAQSGQGYVGLALS
jgi:hypothetical protein